MAKPATVTYTVTEVTVTTGQTSTIDLIIDDKRVRITVPVEIKAHFDQQFSRPNPTALQKKKYATVMNLMRAASLQGRKDK
jgi:hypothetical protein